MDNLKVVVSFLFSEEALRWVESRKNFNGFIEKNIFTGKYDVYEC